MIKSEREIWDTRLLRAMLERIDTVHVGLHDEEYPYVVPLSFGFDIDEERLEVYVHCALRGYKFMLMERDPRVCCTFSAFSNFPRKMYKGHRHDYRSVMAFGTVEEIDREAEPQAFRKALVALLRHYDRIPQKGERRGFPNFDPNGLPKLRLMRITCLRALVFGKSECPVRTPEDVPFVDVYGVPDDSEPYDIDDLLRREKRASPFDPIP